MAAINVKTLFKEYLKDLSEIAVRGDAREESFYPALATLLLEISQATHRPHVHVTTLPKPTDAGNPDFRLWNGTDRIIGYIYAVLYAPTYREKYAEFLRMDFPRIPFTSNEALFLKVAQLGERVTGLHLLQSPELDPPVCRFEGQGDNRVGKGKKEGLRYDPAEQKVYINATQHFSPVADAVWTYRIGGYQVCEKWLKDRRERRLELDDIRTYCRIVTALKLTIDIQREIDAFCPDIEKQTLPLSDLSKG